MLSIKNITKRYKEKVILDNVSFSVNEGSIAMFLGASGVGKSTLLRILNNLEKPDSGSITLNKKKINLSSVNTKHTIGMVFQHFNLFEHLTALENITLTLIHVMKYDQKKAEAIALKLLKHYHMEDKAHTHPSGLSGGQKQRLAIARTLATQPKVICLDEPTSALDPLLTNHVANNIQELAKEKLTVLVASHDTVLLEKLYCTIYLMEKGQIVESVLSKDFYHNKDKYPRLKAFILGT